jgi:hypothetical protein
MSIYERISACSISLALLHAGYLDNGVRLKKGNVDIPQNTRNNSDQKQLSNLQSSS